MGGGKIAMHRVQSKTSGLQYPEDEHSCRYDTSKSAGIIIMIERTNRGDDEKGSSTNLITHESSANGDNEVEDIQTTVLCDLCPEFRRGQLLNSAETYNEKLCG